MADQLGDALAQGDLQSFSDTVNFARHIGIQLIKAEKDRVEGKLPVTRELTNHLPNVHGGAIMSFADAMGAIGAHLNTPEASAGTTTIESKTNFVKPAMEGDTLHAVCTPVSIGRRLSVWQTDIRRNDGKRVALVTQTLDFFAARVGHLLKIGGFCLRGDEEARVSRTHVQIVDSYIFAIGRAKGSRTKIDQIIDDYSEVIVNYLAPYMPADDA